MWARVNPLVKVVVVIFAVLLTVAFADLILAGMGIDVVGSVTG